MRIAMPSGTEVDLTDVAAVDAAIEDAETAEARAHEDLLWLKKKRKQWLGLPIVAKPEEK